MFTLCYTKLISLLVLLSLGFVTYKVITYEILVLDKIKYANRICNNISLCSYRVNNISQSRNEIKKEELFNHIKNYISERKHRIDDYCNKNADENQRSYDVLRRLIVDRDNEITWCPICKAGSTIWMKIFAAIGNEIDPEIKLPDKHIEISKLARKAFPYTGSQAVSKALSKTTKFLIVRHPFERLLSAFRDKIEDKNKTFYYKKFGKYIVKWYRRTNNTNILPSFEEFLQYISFEKLYDEHWRPYYKECSPCFINYDVIMKIETYMNDQTYFVDYLGIDSIKKVLRVNHWDNTNPLGRTDDGIKRKYFSQIPLSLLKNIYKLYEKDFVMFDYSPDEYYAMAKFKISI